MALMERTLVQVRERSFLDLLDLSLVVVRRKPWPIGLAALAGCAPFAALNAWLARDGDFPAIFYVLLLALEIPWATAPLTVMLGGLMFGDRPSAGQSSAYCLAASFRCCSFKGFCARSCCCSPSWPCC